MNDAPLFVGELVTHVRRLTMGAAAFYATTSGSWAEANIRQVEPRDSRFDPNWYIGLAATT